MAKGSTAENLVPLVVLFLVLGAIAAIGLVAYSIANDVGSQTRQKLEKKNVSFTKGGMKVGVKEKSREQQEDSAQNMMVKIWNNSSFPNYKSKLGWMQSNETASSTSTDKRKPYSRSGSSQNTASK